MVVGKVIKTENSVTEVTFRVDDGTGWIDCTRWCALKSFLHYGVKNKEAV